MKIGRSGKIVIGSALAIGGFLFSQYWYYLPGILQAVRDPIQPNHPVQWQMGPTTAATPASQRPPNIILILADDLGYNDISLNGGGVAGGAVPTPNINSIAHDGLVFTN